MNKEIYLEELRSKLAQVDPPMLEAIIKQYEQIFNDGFAQDKSEEEIILGIGDTDFVSNYYLETLSKQSNTQNESSSITLDSRGIKAEYDAKNDIPTQPIGVTLIRGLFVGFGLFLFNAIIVLGPFVAVWSVLLAFFVSGFGVSLSGIALLITSATPIVTYFSIPTILIAHPTLFIAVSFLLISSGIILMLVTLFIGKYLGIASSKYARWNINLIRGDRRA